MVLALVICNLPRLTARYIWRMWAPNDLDILEEICHLEHMNKCTLATPMDSTFVMDATSATDDNARGSSRRPCVGIDPVNAYSALGKHIRLDWTWGIVPSSAPPNKQRSTAISASLSDNMSIRSLTTNSFMDPSASREDHTFPAVSPDFQSHYRQALPKLSLLPWSKLLFRSLARLHHTNIRLPSTPTTRLASQPRRVSCRP